MQGSRRRWMETHACVHNYLNSLTCHSAKDSGWFVWQWVGVVEGWFGSRSQTLKHGSIRHLLNWGNFLMSNWSWFADPMEDLSPTRIKRSLWTQFYWDQWLIRASLRWKRFGSIHSSNHLHRKIILHTNLEVRVCSVLDAIVSKLEWKLVDSFECGLLCNKMREYLATSFNGWMVMKYNEQSDNEQSFNGDYDEHAFSIDHCNYNCGLEIKTPSCKRSVKEAIKKCVDLHGHFHHVNLGHNLCTMQQLPTWNMLYLLPQVLQRFIMPFLYNFQSKSSQLWEVSFQGFWPMPFLAKFIFCRNIWSSWKNDFYKLMVNLFMNKT